MDVGFSPVEPGRRVRTARWQRRMPRVTEGQTGRGGVLLVTFLSLLKEK